jgi:epoxyqueuosine reductase
LLPGTRSILVVALNYYPGPHPRTPFRVSRYAWGRDYHRILHTILRRVARFIREETGLSSRACVDSAPVLEKALAREAGLGWIGKNSLLVTRTYGSWVFLGELFTQLEMEPDQPHPNLCGTCTACLKACPTGALVAPYQLDSRLCISHATIERRTEAFPGEVDPASYVHGCDICQEVCPWNRRFQRLTTRTDLAPGLLTHMLQAGELPSPDRWEELSRGSALRRGGYRRLAVNLRAAGAGNE